MSLSSIASTSRRLGRKTAVVCRRCPPRIHAPPSRRHPLQNGHREENVHEKRPDAARLGPRGVPPISIDVRDMKDSTLITLAAMEDHAAREEILKRHIMDVDIITYEQACKKFDAIEEFNMKGFYLVSLPYKVGILSAALAVGAAVPMVFHLPTAEWFNELAVTTDIPEPRDLETPLEVAIWTWSWMEPPLGTLSFALLTMQFIRGQMINLGIKPYTALIKTHRGRKLANAFPRYDAGILRAYSETATLVDAKRAVWEAEPARRGKIKN